jgi:hypothetical protein
MSILKPNDDFSTLAQAAAYKAYLSLMPQIHHKTVNMSSGATSAEPLKQTNPLEYNELAKKADELICMHFDSESNYKHVNRKEARKATRVAADQLYYHIAPKHNNNSPVLLENMDGTHSSSNEDPSNYKTSSVSM